MKLKRFFLISFLIFCISFNPVLAASTSEPTYYGWDYLLGTLIAIAILGGIWHILGEVSRFLRNYFDTLIDKSIPENIKKLELPTDNPKGARLAGFGWIVIGFIWLFFWFFVLDFINAIFHFNRGLDIIFVILSSYRGPTPSPPKPVPSY